MARQVIWTERAQKERIAIFKYWNNRNGSTIFSLKLYVLITIVRSKLSYLSELQ